MILQPKENQLIIVHNIKIFRYLYVHFLDLMPTLSKQKIRIAQLLEHQTLAVHSLFYQGKRYSKMELEKILEAYYRRQNRQIK